MKPRPEDRTDATMEDGAGVIGSFPASSIWPFVLGMGLFLMVLSIVFGLWLIAPGAIPGALGGDRRDRGEPAGRRHLRASTI